MNYLEDIYRLSFIKRYSNVPKLHEESVAEHGFFVAAIILDLYGTYDFNLGEALTIAISHDMTEIELNDCPHIIKRKYPEIAKAYEICEADVAKQLPKVVAWGAREFDKAEKSTEALVVHLADVIQCLQYATVELKMGNEGYMRDVVNNSLKRKIELVEALEPYERCREESKRGQ
jgi:5'-deoxynucleotidase YfbR-like HD superfamily hydrolase